MSENNSLQPGDKAPDFSLPSSDGGTVSLADYIGKKRIVLYFYPKDNTSGCTKEACSFRDHLPQIDQTDTVVFGVSPDSLKSHHKFIEKLGLNFPLLSDENHEVAEAYGAWGEKSMYGKKYFGIIRKTFIIGKDGKIEHAFHKVKADGHGQEVLNLLA
ncbi:thioredoxin-dependent thiol peroxidase [candidate division KSB1 bacterium]|jgi:peroxiredoxin Q/BCP|nr:thioredoxin-dependent thiol peroxidase [candidate division KSB1 bacterium]